MGVRELRQNLSVYLERVKRGEALTVTEHRRTVAVLRPAGASDDVVAQLVAEGRARPASRAVSARPRPLKVKLAAPLSQVLDELRDDAI